MRAARAAFWTGALGAGWVLAGYPLALLACPPRPPRRGSATPRVTIVIPVHRERELLCAKLRSLEALDYPAGLLDVVVVADGDAALADAARAACPRATVLALPQRSGKPTALNAALGAARGEVVVLTDAHSPLAPDSVRVAAAHFADPAVAGVSGRWAEAGSAYDRYEDALRRLETRSGSTACVFGGFFAVRRDRIPPFPADVVNDDLWLLCRLVEGGGRVVYEPAAASTEPRLRAAGELERRTRIGAGRAQLAGELRHLPPSFAWRLASHKFGRLGLPAFLAAELAGATALAARGRRPFRLLAGAQAGLVAAGALAAAGVVPPGPAGAPARALGQFVLGNLATARGVLRHLRGGQDVLWTSVRA